MSNFPLPYSSLKRSRKPIRPRKKAAIRVGKLGIVRVAGPEMDKLRSDCFWRDGVSARSAEFESAIFNGLAKAIVEQLKDSA